ncbi:putative adenylosuccinate synthase [Yersinia rochesterensis]|uniref:Adenylosuccinate synthase n=1 Tax=Yersinia rochesterensis TaxID=1604335 RepID=A0ABN4FIF6_9GAMM|nr:hypothetical protein [Yersinia rochesterensis]AIN17749.1 putative adenylosuccinate synthase [Yersinia rochesterensis]AJI88607.1 putative adenylosuccinate synthase [Yersinia frederiksenii Y225]AJJ37185.1 putative adenylosuccinate synthase [Yersinia rochesterensis]
MTHNELNNIAVKWLKRAESANGPGCQVALTEVGGLYGGEASRLANEVNKLNEELKRTRTDRFWLARYKDKYGELSSDLMNGTGGG